MALTLKFLILTSLIILILGQPATNYNKCASDLRRPPKNSTECLRDKTYPGVTCCFLNTTDSKGAYVTLCDPRPTELMGLDPTEVFKLDISSYKLTLSEYSCFSEYISISLITIFLIISLLI
jgi:hypothetical protein